MKVSQALDHANTITIPGMLLFGGFSAMDSEREKNEEALSTLRDAYAKEDNPSFEYDVILELADRNRDLCDTMGIEKLSRKRDTSLARGLSDEDLSRGVAALQKRRPATLIKQIQGDQNLRSVAYASKPPKGTILGIDIETTDRYPDRGYIINVGFELMDMAPDSEPYDGEVYFCGLPEMYAEKGVPLEKIHHVSWSDVEGKKPFREDKELQKTILSLMKKYPYMAHNAAFEDSWFMLHLEGYAQLRKAGKINIIDSRDICRCLDPEVKSIPREMSPAALENWARRRGVLAKTESEVHQGLDDTDLMFKTVQAELKARGCFSEAQ